MKTPASGRPTRPRPRRPRRARRRPTKKSTAKAKVYGKQLTITFDRATKARQGQGHRRRQGDDAHLYDKAGKALTKSWTFKGAVKTHKVVVTVLGTKATASKGTSVYLAALKVKA